MSRGCSRRPHIQRPCEPGGIAPLGLALDDEGFAADRELVAGARVRDVAGPHLESGRLRVDAGLAEADDGVGRLAITRTSTGSPPAGV